MHSINISKLIETVERVFASQGYVQRTNMRIGDHRNRGYFWISNNNIMSQQKGVFRVNCIDSLDRTNVVEVCWTLCKPNFAHTPLSNMPTVCFCAPCVEQAAWCCRPPEPRGTANRDGHRVQRWCVPCAIGLHRFLQSEFLVWANNGDAISRA